MKARTLMLVSLLLGVCSVANAGAVWLTNLTIKSYRWWWDGANTLVEVEIKDGVGVNTGGCAPSDYNATTNPNPRFSHWVAGAGLQAHSQYALSTLTAAEAQGKKIDILYDNSGCHGVGGRLVTGIRVVPNS